MINLSGEFGGEKGKRLVFAVCALFERGLGFRVYETCYDGPETATVVTKNDKVRFDILMKQKTTEGGVHYFCECKFRSNIKAKSELRSEFENFVKNALKVINYAKRKYGENHFCFLFVTTIPFEIWEENISDVNYLKKLVGNPAIDINDLIILSNHIKLTIVPGWLIEPLLKLMKVR